MSLANWGFRNTGVIRPASAPIASQHAQYQMETEDNPCNNNDIVLKLTNRENQSVRGNSREVVHNGSTCSEEEQRDHGRCRDASETESSHKDELLNFGVVDLDERFTENEVVVCQQTALVTLVDGIVRASGRRALLYKCAVCALHYTNLDSVRCHLDTHVMSPPFAYREKSVKAPMKIDDDDEVQLHDDAPGIVVKDRTKDADVDVLVLKGSPDASKFGLIQESGSENGLMAVAATTPCLDSRPSAVKIANDVHQDDSGVTSQLQQPHQQPSGDIPSPLQAEDLSKNCQRRLRSLSARRRTIQSLHCRRPTQRLALVTSEMLASDNKESDDPSTEEPVAVEQSVAGGETLANAIRQKEHLGDDVTVVIPSDAPLDVAVRHQGSIRTETPTRAVGVDEAGKHIAHSPVKSIMGHPLVQKKSRISGTGSVSTSAATVPNASDAIQAGVASPDKTSLAVDGTGFTANQMSLINAAAESLQFAGGLPAMFGPLALSTFVNGFGGLVAAASPFLSYYTQMPTGASLASLMAVPGAAGSPIVTSLPSQSTAAVGDSADTKPVVDSSSDSCKDVAGVEMEEVSNGSGGAAGWSQDASLMAGFASSNIKCSSLSRTHSRLNVVRRPIKREDACRPVVLSDGRTAFRCIYCKKDFCTISDVNRHMDFHEDIRPYKCRFCNYYARTNSQLKVHMMRHQGIREYMCRLCNYKGVTQSDLNRHTKSQIHLMKARNECMQCSEGFVSPMNLEQHRQDKHCLPHSSTSLAITGHGGQPL